MDDLLQQGVTAYKAGKRDEARKIFIAVVKQSPDSEPAWGWMYQASNNDQERIHCLKQILRINPKSEKAKQLLDTLMGQDSPFEPKQNVVQPVQANTSRTKLEQPKPTPRLLNKKIITTAIILVGMLVIICVISLNLITPKQQCAKVELRDCSVRDWANDTLIIYSVYNTCTVRLKYVKLVYSVHSISGDLLDSDVEYVEGLDPGERKMFAPSLGNPGGNGYSCKVIVEDEGR